MLKFSVSLVKDKVTVPKPSKMMYLCTLIQLSSQIAHHCLYCCAVHFEDSLNITHQRMHKLYIIYFFKVCHLRCVVKLMVGRVITVSNTTRSF